MVDVFISYKRDERPAVELIAAALRRLGLTVWFDAGVSAGEAFSDEIDREARGATAILVCWSPTARESQWVKSEALIGFEQGKLAACYVAGPDDFSPPTPFNTVHAEDLRAWLAAPTETHAGWKSILRRVGRLCRRADVEGFGALDSQASACELRAWINAHATSPLFMSVENLLRMREAEDAERARLEEGARERRAKAEAERRVREEAERARLAHEEHTRQKMERQAALRRRILSWLPRMAVPLAVIGLISVFALLPQNNRTAGTNNLSRSDGQIGAETAPPRAPTPGQALRFEDPATTIGLGQAATVPFGGAHAGFSLSERGLGIRWGTTSAVYELPGVPDPLACSFIQGSSRIITICRELDYGVMFVGFIDPRDRGAPQNHLNPSGRGFHLTSACAPARQDIAPERDACFARVGRFLLTVAYNGEVGSNLLAIDIARNQVVWPARASSLPDIGAVQTVPARDSQYGFFGIDNTYQPAFAPSVEFTLTSWPARYSLQGQGLEVYGTVQLNCESPWGPARGCEELSARNRALEMPMTWYFDGG